MSRKVAVLMGGWSPEREVSLVSGKACAEGLREGGHEVIEYDVKRDLRALIDFLRPAGGGGPDVVFNALHGKYGEDGCIQGVLEVLAVPYTHSGVLPSAIAMDKPMARHVFTSLGMRVAFGKVIEAWIAHFLKIGATAKPIRRIDEEHWAWHVGLDAESTAILNELWNGNQVEQGRMQRILALFELKFADPDLMRRDIAGRPVYLALSCDDAGVVRMKPQNLLLNLPLHEA